MTNHTFDILVVDDEKEYGEVLKIILEEKGYSVENSTSGTEALEKMGRRDFDLVITDLRMPDMDGRELLGEIKKGGYDSEVILLTAYGTIEQAVDAMKAGAYTYVTKGGDPEELLMEVAKIREAKKVREYNRLLEEKVMGGAMMESRDPKFRQMMELAERAAQSDSNILMLGESGAGKEILASFIHSKSARRKEGFMEINCQALSESILESELFGHEKGSFTGASGRRVGMFEASDGGTLFLDEIGGVSPNLQAKLLKAIENKQIYRLGSSTPVDVDFRLITATNRDLEKDMEEGLFRDDLFYRISTIVLEIPPLRERPDDIPLFVDYFFDRFKTEMKKPINDVKPQVLEALYSYHYPGNVRELKNMIERLVVLSEKGEVLPEYLPSNLTAARGKESPGTIRTDYSESLREYRKGAEKKYIAGLLEHVEGDMDRAAEILGITRRQLLNKITEYGLR